MARVVITGASGLLGRSVFEAFKRNSDTYDLVEGWGHSRTDELKLRQVNLADISALNQALTIADPSIVIHCAAIRRPDEIKNNVELAQKINLKCTEEIAKFIANKNGGFLMFISTDYVFDGLNPPYAEDAPTNPLNEYARQKVEAENYVLKTIPDKSAVLRVPIMYGPVEYLGEGAVDEVLKNVLSAPKGQPIKLDHYYKRNPTHVDDISNCITQMVSERLQSPLSISGIYQIRADECLTKYDMALHMAEAFNLDCQHFVPNTEPPDLTKSAPRPYDCRMMCTRLEKLGITCKRGFKEYIKQSLYPHIPK